MREKILELIEKNPKSYHKIIKKNSEMLSWVLENSTCSSEKLTAKIYSAVYEISDLCKHGNAKKFIRFSQGFGGCGPANSCACTRDQIADSVKSSKSKTDPLDIKYTNEKRKQTMLDRYKVEFNSQRPEVKQLLTKPKISKISFDKLNNRDWLFDEYVKNQRSAVDIAKELGVYYSTVIEYCKRHGFDIRKRSNYSLTESEISQFISNLGFHVINNDWSCLGQKEIDILIPEKKIAIEVNGLYWHSVDQNHQESNSRKHLDKKLLAASNGVDLLHITDWEWNNQTNIIKSMLRAKLGVLTYKIHARKCEVTEISSAEAKKFLIENHMQGFTPSKTYLGLIYSGTLVMVMSLGRSRFTYSQKEYIEIHRIASKLDHLVVGGASKLFKYSTEIFKNHSFISYADYDKSSGAVYRNLGFDLLRTTGPGYFWTDGTNIISRYRTMKQKLPKILENYNQELSEEQNMFAAGYRKYYNCGNLVFVRS